MYNVNKTLSNVVNPRVDIPINGVRHYIKENEAILSPYLRGSAYQSRRSFECSSVTVQNNQKRAHYTLNIREDQSTVAMSVNKMGESEDSQTPKIVPLGWMSQSTAVPNN